MTRQGVQNRKVFLKCKHVHNNCDFNISNLPAFPHWIIIQQFDHIHDTPEGLVDISPPKFFFKKYSSQLIQHTQVE